MHFNPRSLAGATSTTTSGTLIPALFQSTLPCGSDHKPAALRQHDKISIHAPLRERLDASYVCMEYKKISIHAPLRERPDFGSSGMFSNHFNPRSLAGATFYFGWPLVGQAISIHAPLRERLSRFVVII